MVKRFIYPVLGCVVATILAEILVRLFVTSPSNQVFDKELGYWYRPNSSLMLAVEGGAYVSANSIGLLDREISLDSRKKIVVLGDSIAESKQVPTSETFHSFVENRHPAWDVINAGFSSFAPSHYPIVIQRVRQHVDIDLVILLLHTGEIPSIVLPTTLKVYDENGDLTDILPKQTSSDRIKQIIEPVISHSALVTQLMRKLKRVVSDADFLPIWANTKPSPDHDLDKSDSLESKIEKHGRDYMAVLFKRLKEESHAPVIIVYFDTLQYLSNRKVAIASSLGERDVFRDAAIRQHIPFYDLTSALAQAYVDTGIPPVGFPNKMMGVGHLNNFGHNVVAAALEPIIEEQFINESETQEFGEP